MSNQEEYDLFMEMYNKLHESCPKCNGLRYTTTLVGYTLNMDRKEEYKDLNRCNCLDCGDSHYYHDRIPNYRVREIKIEEILEGKTKL